MGQARLVRVAVAVAAAARRLSAAGVPSPRADAELLAAHVLGVPRGRLALAGGLAPDALARFEQLVAARADRVPLQHLTGTAGFGRLELAVGPGAFVPRPETELLAQWAVGTGGAVVVDLASGTGALALAVAHELPAAQVLAVERSPAALAWLRRNAADRAAAGDRPVEVVAGDATDPAVLSDLDGTVDLVVCNPPYVPAGTPVPPEVADHDPPEAVFAGPDGLAVIRPVIVRAARLLRPGGWLGLEHHETHPPLLPRLLQPWFTRVTDHRDLVGRPRYVTGQRVAD
ncbi:MAG: peptide chain release factor N(5)-glutamine methyltransferase [Micromonosporaceae bacterium]|nr:peptide chain release factor N(5)-glutamine methyltransferase [Micromonosporaceae bacterium]